MKSKHEVRSLRQRKFDEFFDNLLLHLAVHDLKVKVQARPYSDEPVRESVIEFLSWR